MLSHLMHAMICSWEEWLQIDKIVGLHDWFRSVKTLWPLKLVLCLQGCPYLYNLKMESGQDSLGEE